MGEKIIYLRGVKNSSYWLLNDMYVIVKKEVVPNLQDNLDIVNYFEVSNFLVWLID
jgi:hypothetical protein